MFMMRPTSALLLRLPENDQIKTQLRQIRIEEDFTGKANFLLEVRKFRKLLCCLTITNSSGKLIRVSPRTLFTHYGMRSSYFPLVLQPFSLHRDIM